jgi:hypothetical protein
MHKNIKKKFSISIFILCIILSACSSSVINSNDNIINIKEYVPSNNLVKVFNGGFENSGAIHIVNKIDEGKYQINQIDYGTGVVSVYKITDEYIRLIYSCEVEIFDKDYIGESNKNHIILKVPIKIGTKWKNEDNAEYEITGVNVKIHTPSGDYSAIEVTIRKDDMERKKYYVKGIGLVKSISNGYTDKALIKVENLDSKVDLGNLKEINILLDKYLGDI